MDGAVRFADIRSGAVVMEIPYHANAPRDCSISIDDRGNHMALIADGKVHTGTCTCPKLSSSLQR